VIAKRNSRSPAVRFLSRIPITQPLSTKSYAIISFADPHDLTCIVSDRYKNRGWALRLFNFQTRKLSSAFPSYPLSFHILALFCNPRKRNPFLNPFRTLRQKTRWVGRALLRLHRSDSTGHGTRITEHQLRVMKSACLPLQLSTVDCQPPRISLLLYILASLLLSFSHERHF
jgi:hypothetical protein